MCDVICVANPSMKKVGRTSVAVNFAASLAVLEKKTLLIDCNYNGNASKWLTSSKKSFDYGLDDLLTGLVSGRAVINKTDMLYLDFIPAGHQLETIEDDLKYNPEKEKVLNIIITSFRNSYDYIILDTPGDKGLLSQSAVIAADSLLIPVLCASDASLHFSEMLGFASRVRSSIGNPVKLSGVIVNRCNDIDTLNEVLSDKSLEELKPILFPTVIPELLNFQSVENSNKPYCLVDIKSDYSEAFLDLSFEFLYREKNTPVTSV